MKINSRRLILTLTTSSFYANEDLFHFTLVSELNFATIVPNFQNVISSCNLTYTPIITEKSTFYLL